jgi:predicted hotdog family 3-hydroxylacyl-ACP dehydratase
MCLLDEVRTWDPLHIECASRTHRAPEHPLRAHGRLGSACLIEYAAQAMAVHAALRFPAVRGVAGEPAAPRGMLASARAVELLVADLDQITEELLIRAERLHSDARGALYAFTVSAGERLLAQGRAAVLFEVASP